MTVQSKPAADGRMPSIKREDFTENEHFVLDAAHQMGFETNDDDVTEYRVTDEWLIEFVGRVAAAAIEQVTANRLPSKT